MPSFNRGKRELTKRNWETVQVNCALMRSTFTPNIDSQHLWGDISSDEIPAVTNYTVGGLALANKALAQSNSDDTSRWEADTVAFGALGIGATIGFAVLYYHHASDAGERHLISYYPFTPLATNGVNISLQWGASGAALRGSHVAAPRFSRLAGSRRKRSPVRG